MTNYKITIQYDGTRYKGWQVQNNTDETIQGKLENILTRLAGSNVDVIGSGRTDAGVHAIGQVANFHMETPDGMQKEDILNYVNQYLPEDIAVTNIDVVDDRFHARYSAKSKTYRYRIHVSRIADVFDRKYVYTYLDMPIDVDLMRHAADSMTGTHDYKAFCGNRHMKKSTVRTVHSININEVWTEGTLKEIDIEYTGDGFLQNMIRIMTGTLIEVGTGRRDVNSIAMTLASLDRDNAGYTAPAKGLSLVKVMY